MLHISLRQIWLTWKTSTPRQQTGDEKTSKVKFREAWKGPCRGSEKPGLCLQSRSHAPSMPTRSTKQKASSFRLWWLLETMLSTLCCGSERRTNRERRHLCSLGLVGELRTAEAAGLNIAAEFIGPTGVSTSSTVFHVGVCVDAATGVPAASLL